MTPRPRKLTLAVLVGLSAGAASPAFAQPTYAAADPTAARERAQQIIDQYAPGMVSLKNLGVGTPSAGTVAFGVAETPAASTPAAVAARARAQEFLDRYAPGRVTLGERGVRVETPGTVVDTRGPEVRIVRNGVEMETSPLYRLASAAAEEAYRAGDIDRAERWLTPVVSDRPNDAEARQFYSLVMFRRGNFAAAAESARVALESADPWTWRRLSAFHATVADYETLYRVLRKTARDNPHDGKVLFLLAYHERMLGRVDEAERTLDQAAEHLPAGWLTETVRRRLESGLPAPPAFDE